MRGRGPKPRLELVDFRKIRVEPRFRRATPTDAQMWHRRSLRWLTRQLETPHVGPTVVISHHAPSARSLQPANASSPIQAAYASALDDLIQRYRPSVWVHGHTHWAVDYEIGMTRVISNPRGYPDEPVPGFDPGLVVDIDEAPGAGR